MLLLRWGVFARLSGSLPAQGAADASAAATSGSRRAAGAPYAQRVSYVAINVLTVPDGAGAALEQRFAARQGGVDSAPGFEHFALLRPVEGTQDYLVYTRWRSEADFTAWRSSQSFGQGHGGRGEGERPAASGATLWGFEVVQESGAQG
jgi:heme-degrading monooxygenase HmoA